MPAIHLRNRIECHTNRVREQVQTSDLPSTKEGLHLGPHLLNGIQIGTVGRKIHELFIPFSSRTLPDSLIHVKRILFHQTMSRGLKVGKQDFFPKYWKRFPVVRPWYVVMLSALQADGRKDCRCLAVYSRGMKSIALWDESAVHTGGSGSY